MDLLGSLPRPPLLTSKGRRPPVRPRFFDPDGRNSIPPTRVPQRSNHINHMLGTQMNLRILAVLGATTSMVVAVPYGSAHDMDQSSKPLETALGYYLDGTAAWRQENPAYVAGGEAPRFWIREYRWGPGRDVLLADAYAVFDRELCEPLVHLVHTWNSAEERVAVQNFGPAGMHLYGSSWHEPPGSLVTEAEGRLPDGTSIKHRDVSDLSNPNEYTSVGHRWDGEAWVVGDSARWERASTRVCS